MSDARAVSRFELARLSPAGRARLFERAEADLVPFLDAVRPIIEAVRADGDEALVRFARELDRAEVPASGLTASAADFERAERSLAPEVGAAIDYAVLNIRRFHEAQMPQEMWLKEIRPGAFAGDRYRPIPSVACCVPRGKGAFPSVTMTTTIPAVVAGVPKIVVITPPGPDGRVDDATLVAAHKAGVAEVYECGGAQGVAAVTFGTATVPKVAKVIGPGSPYVLAAKRLLADRIDVGLPAGPSEAIVLADGSANGRIAALDLVIDIRARPRQLGLPGHRHARCGRGRDRSAAGDPGRARRRARGVLASRAKGLVVPELPLDHVPQRIEHGGQIGFELRNCVSELGNLGALVSEEQFQEALELGGIVDAAPDDLLPALDEDRLARVLEDDRESSKMMLSCG